jgi:hypothetical protein
MNPIDVVEIEMERSQESVLAPNANHHGHVATAFSWS